MSTDPLLNALALIELVQRLGGAGPLYEYTTPEGAECGHQISCLALADIVVSVAESTGFDLQSLIDERRERILTPDEPPPGIA
jgi:hypothetical protein